ncbi:uncharacterized protein LOC114264041 [Camellia sinensis]|uniref:uncharacterized protein LOC114264041 n=1 Tax=Camellia sinensis TaxID=4442 RepID=UPI001036B37E|nr:uncharacterized protein LOC114264041 [Camellia sinensis]
MVEHAKLVLDYDREISEYVRNAKESWVVTGCTLMVDIENADEHSCVNVFSYCPKGVVFLKSSVTSRDRMTWIYLKDIVSSTIDKIGVDKVLQLIVDNDEGFDLTEYILLEYPQVYKTRCAIHGIQSLLMDLFSKVDWVRRVTMAGKMILSYIDKRPFSLSRQIEKHTTYKKFEHPCLARFASNFLLLHSISEFEAELKDLQLLDASLDWKSLDFNMQELAKWVATVIESTPFWTLVEEVLHIVDILFQVLRLVSGDAPTSGYLYEAMKKASTEIRQCCNEDQAKYKLILDLFEERKMNDIIHPIHAAAAFLNPDIMCNENFVEDLEMKESISFIEDNLVAASEKQAFAEQVQLYRMKAPNVFTTTALKMSKTSHPRLWWHYCGEHLPVLKKYAVRILSQPCSSSCKIKKLMPKTDDDYTKMNVLMMEKFG